MEAALPTSAVMPASSNPASTLPTSAPVRFLMGWTINIMSLSALAIAIGMVVDNAVVVRENIFRHMEMGKDPMRAAREGTAEIGLAVMATAATTLPPEAAKASSGGGGGASADTYLRLIRQKQRRRG